jgi:hypothetical protein
MLDALAGTQVIVGVVPVVPPPEEPALLGVGTCKWCEAAVELRRVWGWVHRDTAAGLVVCGKPRDDAPRYCRAEPAGVR